MKNYRKLYGPLAAVILILLDQLSKQWIVNHIPLNAIRKCVPGIFSLTYYVIMAQLSLFCRISSGSLR